MGRSRYVGRGPRIKEQIRRVLSKTDISREALLSEYRALGEQCTALINEVSKLCRISDAADRRMLRDNERLERQRDELAEALENIKTLKSLIPICASCNKIRNDKQYWLHVEAYIAEHSGAKYTQGLCSCVRRMYPEKFDKRTDG